MAYFLSADGGGSKLAAVLFDDAFRLIAAAEAGGTNTHFLSEDAVDRHFARIAEQLLAGRGITLSCVYHTIVGPGARFLDALRVHAPVLEDVSSGEGALGLLAGAGVPHGLLALSGTGSDVFYIQPGVHDTIGGWGTIFGDEGSGYDIGARALRAVIFAEDGRGPDTLLRPMLYDAWSLDRLWDIVSKVYGTADPRRLVASVTRLAAEAACAGDAVAVALFDDAADALAHMAATLLDRHHGQATGPAVVSGGVWKGFRPMFARFAAQLAARHPSVPVLYPQFDPVVGGVVRHALRTEHPRDAFWPFLMQEYAAYTY